MVETKSVQVYDIILLLIGVSLILSMVGFQVSVLVGATGAMIGMTLVGYALFVVGRAFDK